MAATLDGMVEPLGAVFEAKFMLPWSFSEVAAAEKHMAQLQHNMWVTNARAAVLSIITGGGKWIELTIHADPRAHHREVHRVGIETQLVEDRRDRCNRRRARTLDRHSPGPKPDEHVRCGN